MRVAVVVAGVIGFDWEIKSLVQLNIFELNLS